MTQENNLPVIDEEIPVQPEQPVELTEEQRQASVELLDEKETIPF